MSLLSNQTNSLDPLAVHSRIFVGNLNTFQCSKSDVERIFQRYGRIAGNANHLVNLSICPESSRINWIDFCRYFDAQGICLYSIYEPLRCPERLRGGRQTGFEPELR